MVGDHFHLAEAELSPPQVNQIETLVVQVGFNRSVKVEQQPDEAGYFPKPAAVLQAFTRSSASW